MGRARTVMRKKSRAFSVMAWALTVAMLLLPSSPVFAGQYQTQASGGDYAQGRMDGDMMANSDFGGGDAACWFVGGFFLIGVPLAYMMKSDAPPHAMIGKSGDYSRGFIQGYKKVNSSKKKWAWLGCLVEIASSLAYNATE